MSYTLLCLLMFVANMVILLKDLLTLLVILMNISIWLIMVFLITIRLRSLWIMLNLSKNLLPLKVRMLQQQHLLRQERLQRIKNNRFAQFHRELYDFVDRVEKGNFSDPYKYKFLFNFA